MVSCSRSPGRKAVQQGLAHWEGSATERLLLCVLAPGWAQAGWKSLKRDKASRMRNVLQMFTASLESKYLQCFVEWEAQAHLATLLSPAPSSGHPVVLEQLRVHSRA